MASLSQSLAKLRSPAVLVAQNGSSLALPNYMADEVEESRATIVAALCNSASPLGGPSRMASRTAAATQSMEPASGSGILNLGGRGADADVDNDDDQEDSASRPMARPPARSRRIPPGSPAQGQYVPQFSLGPGDGSPRRPTSSTPPLPPSPRTHTPLVSFSDGSPRRQATSASDSAAAAAQPMHLRGGGVGGASSGLSNYSRRPLSASATTQAQAPLDPFAAAAAQQQDLVAAVTGRIIQSYDYDDDSLDEEELECDLAAAQSTLARALEMARSGTTASLRSSGATTSDASTLSSRRSSVAAPAGGGGAPGGGRLSTRYSTISQVGSGQVAEREITPAAPAGGGGGGPAISRQPQQQQPNSQRRASGGPCSATAAAAAAVAATAAADRHGELPQASRGSGRSGYSPWSPQQSAASAPPSPATTRTPFTASTPAGAIALAAAPAGMGGAAAGVHSQPGSSSGGGFGYPLRRALHLGTAGGTAAQGDVEAGQGALTGGVMGGGGGARASGVGGSAGGGIGRFKGSTARQTAAGGADAAAVRGASHSGGQGGSHSGGSGGLKGLLKLAKKAFRRSTGGAAVVAPPLQSLPLALSDPDRPAAVSPVAVPRTPPAKAGASSALGSPDPSTAGGWPGGALDREQSGVSSGRTLPASPVVTASSTVSQISVVQQPYGRSSTSGTAGSMPAIRASPSSPPLSSPSSLPPPMSSPLSLPSSPTPRSTTVSAPQASGPSLSHQAQPQLQSWSERGSSSSGDSSGGHSPAHTAFAPPASAPPLYAGSGGGGGATTSSQRRRSSTVSAGGGHVSELQVTAHVQSFMHYQQQMLQQQMQQQQQQGQQHQREQPLQQRLSNSFTVGGSGSSAAATTASSGGSGGGSRPGSAHEVLSAAELGRSGSALGSSRSASGEVGGDRESIGTRRSTPILVTTGAAAAAAKTPYQPAGGGIGGWQTAPALQVVPPMPPPPSPPIKIIPVGGAAGGGSAGGSPRWSPRSPASSSCHVGSPLGPYYQQQLQQQKSYTLATQPTSPRSSCANDCSPVGGGGIPSARCDDRADRPVNTPPASGPNSSPSPTALELQQQQQYYPYDLPRGILTSRTSPTVPFQRVAADGRLAAAGGSGGDSSGDGGGVASAPTSPASPRSSLSGMANGTSGSGAPAVGKPPPSFGVAGHIV